MLILASASPRRKQILAMLGYTFEVRVADCDERISLTNPEELVKELSRRKALAVQSSPSDVVIGSDTVVFHNGTILGKPKTTDEAAEMLRHLSGSTHTVYTGICVRSGKTSKTECVRCDVRFKKLTEQEISTYVKSGEPMDKAGAYGIQGPGCAFVESINGDFYTVMGLPACRLNCILKEFSL